MITDDDPVTLFLHQVMVKKSELSAYPLSFSSGQETLHYLDDHLSADIFGLILLDINMPEMTGWQLLDAIQIKPYADRIYVVMVTSSVDINDRKKADSYKQVIGYMEKPVSANRLVDFQQTDGFKQMMKCAL